VGDAFPAPIAVLLGNGTGSDEDDLQRFDTPWGPVLLKVRICIVIAIHGTFPKVIVLGTRGNRGIEDLHSAELLKKYVEFFHCSLQGRVTTRSPWGPISNHGFNSRNDKRSVADITKLYRLDYSQEMLKIGFEQRPGLKLILEIVDSPDGAVGNTSSKTKATLASIAAEEAHERPVGPKSMGIVDNFLAGASGAPAAAQQASTVGQIQVQHQASNGTAAAASTTAGLRSATANLDVNNQRGHR